MNSLRNAIAGTTVVMFALAACGGEEPSAGLLPPVPVRVEGASGAAETDGRSMTAAADTAAQSDMMFSPWRSLRFVAAGDITLPSGDTGWTYPADATPDRAAVETIAAALGVNGDLVALPADQGGGWRIGPDDGTGPALNVSASGMLDWWYSNAWALDDVRATTMCIEPSLVDPVEGDVEVTVESDGKGSAEGSAEGSVEGSVEGSAEGSAEPGVDSSGDVCVDEEPPRPENVPDEAAATALAAALVDAAALDVSGSTVETWADEWSAQVSYTSATGELPRSTGFGFGENGTLQWASGTLATPVAAGPYPLIGLDEAVQRLNDRYGFDEASADMVSDDAVLVDPAMGDIEPMPAPESDPIDMVVTVSSASAGFWSAWDADGSVWFVPAYEFTGDDGGVWTIPAVTDDYLIDDPFLVEPMPDVVVPLPPDTPVTGQPGPDEAIVEDQISDEDAQRLVGMTEAQVDDEAAANGWTVRVAARDGEEFALTADYVPTRVNVTYVDGIATAVAVG
jgi:hypothetical protein